MFIQPPTDNLYKFLAIFGLILCISGAFYPWVKVYEVRRDIIEVTAELDQAEKTPEKVDMVYISKRVKQLDLAHTITAAIAVIGIGCMAVGGILMVAGFRLWYIRVQKPLDAQLEQSVRRPAESARRNRSRKL